MISRITFAPQSYAMKYNQKNDNISFQGAKAVNTIKNGVRKNNSLNQIVSDMFVKLSATRTSENLGTYMATTKNADVYLRETKLGKEAQLTLSNGVFGDKSYMNFVIEREAGKAPKITSSDETMSSKEAAKIVETYLQDAK
ncbi:MAG: hypothetical protein ACLSA2_11565 [Candidatus Gastranaerophilaceae bacterium]